MRLNTISMREVYFRYTEHAPNVLEGINLDLGVGVQGLLGPNGAGKTTLIRIIAGITAPNVGTLLVDNEPLKSSRDRSRWRAKVGYLPQHAEWFGGYTVEEFIQYFAQIRGVPRKKFREYTAETIESVGLEGERSSKLRTLSGGQRQRALIAQALVHQPEVLILDEPTASLDPVQRIELKRLITRLGESRAILVSTHLIEDLMQCAGGITILNRGRVAWNGTPVQLAERGAEVRVEGAISASSDAEAGMLDVLAYEAGVSNA